MFKAMSSYSPFVSFIIPVFNEELNIQGVFRDLFAVLEKNPLWDWELIVIEDGSKDNTRKVIMELVEIYPDTQLILHDQNRGWTQSVKEGMAKARGEYLMYIGADEEFDCSELPAFIEPLLAQDETHADIVLGVRWQRNAYKLHRFFLSVVYIFFLNYLFKMRVNDYNWSQVWSRKFLNNIELESKSLFLLPEIILKASDLGYSIKEIPSNHRGRKAGKSSLNIKIMGHALWEAILFFNKRRSKNYSPAATKTGVHKPREFASVQQN